MTWSYTRPSERGLMNEIIRMSGQLLEGHSHFDLLAETPLPDPMALSAPRSPEYEDYLETLVLQAPLTELIQNSW